MHLLWGVAAGALVAILLIWLGYPLAIWCAARLVARPIRPNATAAATRRVSVVLATREGPSVVAERVRNLFDTDHPASLLEVVVALDADGAQSGATSFDGLDDRVRVVKGDLPGGKACALNAAVRAATGEILIFADTAQRFERQTIPVLVAALEDERFGAVSGALTLGSSAGASPMHWYWSMEKMLRYNESLIHSSIGVTGAVYATRRDLWPEPPAGTLLDDVFVPMALVLRGHRVGFAPAAKATDVRTFDNDAEKVRKTRTLTGVVQLLSLLPGIVSVRNPVVVQFVFHKLARLATPVLAILMIMAALPASVAFALQEPSASLAIAAIVALLLLVVPSLRARTRDLLRWGWSLQEATLRAVVNGVLGRWGVWTRPK